MINGHDRVGEVRVDGIKRGVELIKGGRLTLKPLITNIYNLDQINEAFEDAYDKPKGYIKSVIVM
jgi:threonine dehydrogenase-like Zn-dependent dehydrogenase